MQERVKDLRKSFHQLIEDMVSQPVNGPRSLDLSRAGPDNWQSDDHPETFVRLAYVYFPHSSHQLDSHGQLSG